ncbi:glycosyltransferase [Methanobrevibacter sp.]|uniref:glycosyltransferase n=1 Tax=Methanobrevibacter sp. TaxID=66852 RepID=UPI0025FB1FD1|nr:glycosyltransferase [Methanobrevibacter sp.]MBQ6511124.1 glycosyltransferase [Methanobrevibacter sp.]
MSYKISIIIPVYNVENYLRNTLNSVISQSIGVENLEVILIDDKSSDGSADIIKEYVNRYSNFKGIYFDKGSGFPGKPRNVGLKYATAEYIMYLDSDDWLEENACEVLYDEIIKEDADIVCGAFTKISDDGTRQINHANWVATLTSPDEESRWQKTRDMVDDSNFKLVVTDLDKNPTILGTANVWAKIFKRDFIINNGLVFPEDIVAQDSVFLLESFFCAEKIVFINDVIVNYNNERTDLDSQSISHVKTNENLYGRIKAYDLMYHISKRFSKEKLFYKYLLAGKLEYWFTNYLLAANISTFEISNIFKKYYHLFRNSYRAIEMSGDLKNIFSEINIENFDIAAEHTSKLQSQSIPNSDNPIKVSVIVPVYNNEKFLKKCLDSIANQTLAEIEVICIDDGSSDNSLEILNSYKLMDERFRIISQKNSGAAIARNNGLKMVRGDFVAFVDSDDWLELNALELLYDNAVSNGAELVLFDSVEHHKDNKLKERCYMAKDSIKNHNNFTFNYQYKRNFVMNGYLVIWSKFYKTSFLKNNNITFSNHLIFNDVLFHIKSMLMAKKISYCPHILYNYLRTNQNSIQSKIGLSEKSFVLLDIMDEIEEYLIDNGFYEELELDFIKFKLTELRGRLNKLKPSYRNDFYKLIKSYFQNMHISDGQIKDLSFENYRFFVDVLTYDMYYEYYYYQENNTEYFDIKDGSKNFRLTNEEIQNLKDKSQISQLNSINDEKFEFLKKYIVSMESLIDRLQNDNKQLKEDLQKTKKARYYDEKAIESLIRTNNEFTDLQENLEDLANCAIEQQTIINTLLAEKNELNSTINNLSEENNKLKLKNREFETSNSWKVTKPLRMVKKLNK